MNLTPEQYAALVFLAEQQNDEAVRVQMANLEAAGTDSTHTKLQIRQPVPRTQLPDGPAPRAIAVTDAHGQVTGELLLWIRDGRIDNVEQPWFGDAPPTALPRRDRVRKYD